MEWIFLYVGCWEYLKPRRFTLVPHYQPHGVSEHTELESSKEQLLKEEINKLLQANDAFNMELVKVKEEIKTAGVSNIARSVAFAAVKKYLIESQRDTRAFGWPIANL